MAKSSAARSGTRRAPTPQPEPPPARRAGGRPANDGETVVLSFSLTPEIRRRLRRAAADADLSVSEYVRGLFDRSLPAA